MKSELIIKAIEHKNLAEFKKHFDRKEPVDNKGRPFLHTAISEKAEEISLYLINEAKVNLELTDLMQRKTALHEAAKVGNLLLVKLLIEKHQVNYKAVDGAGTSLLHFAACSGNLALVHYVVTQCKPDIRAKSNEGSTVLDYAFLKNNIQVYGYLLSLAVLKEDACYPLCTTIANKGLSALKLSELKLLYQKKEEKAQPEQKKQPTFKSDIPSDLSKKEREMLSKKTEPAVKPTQPLKFWQKQTEPKTDMGNFVSRYHREIRETARHKLYTATIEAVLEKYCPSMPPEIRKHITSVIDWLPEKNYVLLKRAGTLLHDKEQRNAGMGI